MGLRDVLSEAVVRLMGDNDDDNNMTRATMSDHDDDGNNIIEYLVGCTWAPQVPLSSMSSSSMSPESSFPALHLLAGNSDGDGYLFQVDADRITPLMHLKGGHKGCIRDFSWMECSNNGGDGMNGRVLVTGGEDARLCQWDVYGTTGVDGGGRDSIHHRGSRGGEGGGPILSGRGGRSNLVNGNSVHEKYRGGAVGRKGKKKFSSPY
jgi:hypothetical protein